MAGVTEEDVRWIYRTLLKREPESEQVLRSQEDRWKDLREMVRGFMQSAEYRARLVSEAAPLMNGLHSMQDIEVCVEQAQLDALLAHVRAIWSRYGAEDPYWSVLTSDHYRGAVLSEAALSQFYASGAQGVDFFERNCAQHGITPDAAWAICDFGCGVGRVGAHFVRRYRSYLGVDISAGHLARAGTYLAHLAKSEPGLGTARLRLLGDFLADPSVGYDVYYSFIVLQHNPPPVAYFLLSHGLSRVRLGGLACFQVPNYLHDYRFSVQDYLRGDRGAGRREGMEMHPLPQPYVFRLLMQHGYELLKALPDGSMGPSGLSMMYFAQRTRGGTALA